MVANVEIRKRNSWKFRILAEFVRSSSSDLGFGIQEINQILFLADMKSYSVSGHSLSGRIYNKVEVRPDRPDQLLSHTLYGSDLQDDVSDHDRTIISKVLGSYVGLGGAEAKERLQADVRKHPSWKSAADRRRISVPKIETT